MMLRGLLEKELRQHSLTFSILLVLLLVGLGLITGNHRLARLSGSGIQGFAFMLWTLVPLASLTLGHVLIAAEFRQRTQLFLEGLPLPRWRFIALKYALGLGVLMLLGGAAIGVVLWHNWEREALTWNFARILVLKSAAWIFFVHALFFTHAFLGRYRWVAAGAALIVFINLSLFGMPAHAFAPLRLLDPRFAYDRDSSPLPDVLESVAIAAAISAIGFAIGLMRDASVASLLAERMSAREKSVFAILLLAGVLGSGVVIEKNKKTSPVHMAGAIVSPQSRVTVSVAAAMDHPSDEDVLFLQAISLRFAEHLQELAEYLDIAQLPPVFVVYRPDFAADRFENGDLEHSQGLLVRANLRAEKFRERELERWLVEHLLVIKSAERLKLERNAWLLDGFPRWWQHRAAWGDRAEISESIVSEAAQKAGLSADSFRRWFSVRKAAGSGPAQHLAASGLRALESKAGDEATRRFLSSILGRPATKDARTWLREVATPWPRVLRRETGMTLPEFVEIWRLPSPNQTTASSIAP